MNNIPKEDLLFYLHILFQGYPKGSFGWMWKVGNILIYDLLMCILISEQGWMLETTASCQSLPLTSTKLKQRILFLRCLDPVSNKSLNESANWLSYSSPDIRCSRICPPLSRHTFYKGVGSVIAAENARNEAFGVDFNTGNLGGSSSVNSSAPSPASDSSLAEVDLGLDPQEEDLRMESCCFFPHESSSLVHQVFLLKFL